MSLQFLSSLNKPPIVATTGVVITLGFPLISALPLGVLRGINLVSFAINVIAVGTPGRIDGEQARRLEDTDTDPTATPEESASETSPLFQSPTVAEREPANRSTMELRNRTLVRPAPWAFAIWMVIYLGEATFVVAQFVPAAKLARSLPSVSIPFAAANLLQSLWCAAFRPSYDEGWHRFVSCFLLGATAYSLSYIPARDSWFFVPLAIHFGKC